MHLTLSDRKTGAPLWIPGVVFEIQTLEWQIQGGPSSALVQARPSAGRSGPNGAPTGSARLSQLAQLLRCPASISDEYGAPCWWGYIHSVEIHLSAGFCLAASLDGLYNRVAVRYRDERIAPEVNPGWQFQTAWATDSASIAEYGRREGIFHLPQGFPASAESYAARLLAQHKRPALGPAETARPGTGGQADAYPFAVLHLRGWWQTLAWQFFSEARGFAGFNGGGAVQQLGSAASNALAAQSFSIASPWTAASAFAKLARYGAPGDMIGLDVRADSAGQPGAVMLSAQLPASALSGEIGWARFSFPSPALLAAGTYWIVLWRSGAPDAANYYRAALDEGLAFGGGVLRVWNGAAWAARSPDADLVFSLHGQAETSQQIKVMADPLLGGGQFLRGVVVVEASGVQARQYRDGRASALEEIRELLGLGSSSAEPMMAQVNAERWLVVRRAPPIPAVPGQAGYLIQPDAQIRQRSGAAVPPSLNPLGQWAKVSGLEQAGGDMNSAGAVQITRAVWRAGRLVAAWEK